ncbi:hypothetical protein [Lancefieldella rimae]|uniref:hypothetical protein n=1 Tax=Lancefieldella rimae TaxID=1383 RepID=UPI00288067A8|nr:hypothetical protein [Lancefieldella rimae]
MTEKPLQSVLEWFLFCVSGLNSLIALVLPKTELPEIRQVWLGLPYLLQVWHILTKLAASMVNRAQLAASLAALGNRIMLIGLFALLCRNLAVAVEFTY